MVVAVAKRPVEQFETEAAIPDWANEPDDEMFNYIDDSPLVDADGNPIYQPGEQYADPMAPTSNAPRPGDQQWIDDVLNRPAPPPIQQRPQPQQPGQPLPIPQQQPLPPNARDPLAPRSGQPNAPQVSGDPAQR
jgi:penicillin-binding protein 1A